MDVVPPAYKDRSAALVVFGVIEIVLGILVGLLVPLMILGQILGARMSGEPPPLRQLVPGMFTYGVLAVALIWLGIGALRARRWARALSLVLAWSWLLMGTLATAFSLTIMPRAMRSAASTGQSLPEAMMPIVLIVTGVVMGIIMIVIPGGLVLFFRGRNVKATCEARDPVARWTDACPLPILGTSLWLALGAFSMLTVPISMNGVLPVFGVLLSGWAGSLACVATASIMMWVAWGFYRLRPVAWWVAMVSMSLMAASGLVTFSGLDLMEMYRLAGYPEGQIEMFRQASFLEPEVFLWIALSCTVPWFAWLLFVKRWFPRSA